MAVRPSPHLRSVANQLSPWRVTRAADRAARFAVRDKRDKRLSRRLSRDWVLTVGFGIALFAAILYLTLGVHLHSSAIEVTRELSGKTTLNECCHMISARVASSAREYATPRPSRTPGT